MPLPCQSCTEMPPRGVAPVKLDQFTPSAEELAEARAVLQRAEDPLRAERAAMATFTAWAKQNGQNQKALDSKLQDRKDYLMKFLCWQAKDKKAKLNSESKRTVTTSKTKKNLTGWKSLEFMKRGSARRSWTGWSS